MKRIGVMVAAGAVALALPLWGSAASRPASGPASATAIELDPHAPGARSRLRGAIDACVTERRGGRAAARCAGMIAEPCLRLTEAGSAVQASVDCYRWETAGWAHLLEDYGARLDQRFAADPARSVRLRDSEVEWAADRARRCAQAEAASGLRGQAAAAACELKEHSRRALYYRALAREAGLL